MADIPLDYGSAEADAAMQDEEMNVAADDQTQSSKFYPLPAEEGVSAGAQRGPSPLSREEQRAMDDALLLGEEEPDQSEPPAEPAVEEVTDIRLDALHIEGLPITQLSTSRLFAYITHFGAQPLGLEWIDDQRCKIIFPNEEAARLGLEYLCPTPTDVAMDAVLPPALPDLETIRSADPETWDASVVSSLVAPRKAHRVPGKLYNAVEREAAKKHRETLAKDDNAGSTVPEDAPEIYREMEEADRREKLESKEIRGLLKLRSSLWIRYTLKDQDVKPSRAASRSQWYRDHGYEAGREIVPKLLDIGEVREAPELFPHAGNGEQATSLPSRPNWASAGARSDERRGRGRSDYRAVMDELDSELDAHLAARDRDENGEPNLQGRMMADVLEDGRESSEGDLMGRLGRGERIAGSSQSRWGHDEFERRQHGGGGGRRSRRGRNGEQGGMEALDEELEEMQYARDRQRSASPGRMPDLDAGRVKIRGRGAMKAPRAGGSRGWGADAADYDYGNERYGGESRRNRRRRGGDQQDEDSSGRSLASRLGESDGDLLSRLGGPSGGKSLAERFG